GNNRTACEVVADECFFADSKKDSAQGGGSFGAAPSFSAPSADTGLNSVSSGSDFEELVGDDGELPF
ncbi:MAG: single-stranded DNA-binding protein, partial [Oscillospiraceae bacterium]|nr:single-stranded DNA-binding protein [Oscillospiraceae bacterium]